jgi:alpha-L-rhamnosidase
MRYYFLLILFFVLPMTAPAKMAPVNLTCEYLKDPQVIDIKNLRLSWVNEDPYYQRNQFQTAYKIIVAGSVENFKKEKQLLWNSGKVMSNESVNIEYAGTPLRSRQDCWWQVRVCTQVIQHNR